MNLKPAIFLDRDNTLTIDEGYSFEIEKFEWNIDTEIRLVS